MVSEQMMATHAKSKMAANLLRLGFIDFFLVLGFSVYICVGLCFGGRTNVFLLGKAETAVENPPSFCRRPTKSRSISRREFSEGKRTRYNPRRYDRSWLTICSRSPKTPATFSNRLVPKTARVQGLIRTRLIRGCRISSCALTF
jgi:hypothetical protein